MSTQLPVLGPRARPLPPRVASNYADFGSFSDYWLHYSVIISAIIFFVLPPILGLKQFGFTFRMSELVAATVVVGLQFIPRLNVVKPKGASRKERRAKREARRGETVFEQLGPVCGTMLIVCFILKIMRFFRNVIANGRGFRLPDASTLVAIVVGLSGFIAFSALLVWSARRLSDQCDQIGQARGVAFVYLAQIAALLIASVYLSTLR